MQSPFLYADVLMKILAELWYGNISPFEQCTRGDKRLKELLPLVARNRDELGAFLTEKQKETLEKFEDCMNEMHSICYHSAHMLQKADLQTRTKAERLSSELFPSYGCISKETVALSLSRYPMFFNIRIKRTPSASV